MPLVQIHLLTGRTPEQKQELIRRVTQAVHETVEAPLENIRVVLDEIPPEHWAVGGQTLAERRRSQ